MLDPGRPARGVEVSRPELAEGDGSSLGFASDAEFGCQSAMSRRGRVVRSRCGRLDSGADGIELHRKGPPAADDRVVVSRFFGVDEMVLP